jgi:hypothetical protein
VLRLTTMRFASRLLLGGWVGLLLLGGCANILGLDEYSPETGTSAGMDGLDPLGTPCETGETCDSGLCRDALCCDAECDAVCAACDLAGTEGRCTARPPTTTVIACSGVCDGDGGCVTSGATITLLSGLGDEQPLAIANAPADGFVIAGRFTGDVMTPMPLGPSLGLDGFVVRFDAASMPIWAKSVGGPTGDELRGVATAKTGEVVAVGYATGNLMFAAIPYTFTPAGDPLIVRYSATGTELWLHMPSQDPLILEMARSVAIDAEGNSWVGGIISDGTMTDGFLTVLDPDGLTVGELVRIGTPDLPDSVMAVAVHDETSRVIVAGATAGDLLLPDAEGTGLGPDPDMFLAMFDISGGLVWAKVFGAASGTSNPLDVAFDEDGGVVVTGRASGTVDFGGVVHMASADDDIFIASYTSSGDFRVSQVYPAPQPQHANAIAVDAGGRLLVAGDLLAAVQLGPNADSLLVAGGTDGFVGRFTPQGQHLTSFSFGDVLDQSLRDVAVAADGTVRMVGWMAGTVDSLEPPQTALDATDAIIVTLPP